MLVFHMHACSNVATKIVAIQIIPGYQLYDNQMQRGPHGKFAVIKYNNDLLGDVNCKFYLLKVINSCE